MTELTSSSCSCCAKIQEHTTLYQNFISSLSHEIRNPLTLIYSSLQLLEKDCPQVTHSDLWPQIHEDLQTTLHLLRDVSSLNGKRPLHLKNIQMLSFLESLTSSFRPQAALLSISFDTDFSAIHDSVYLSADEIKLREALTNLLVNASDAVSGHRNNTPEYLPQITCSALIRDSFLQIHIRDNGPGIPEEYLDTLFDPFVTHKSNGTGLGLNIVKNIAAHHNGTVSIDTSCREADSYTDFCFSLPLSS